jgi:hypothetical protein
MADQPGEIEQLGETEDPERPGPLEQGVKEVSGGQHVGEGTVRGSVRQSERRGQGPQLAVGHGVTDESTGQGQRVHRVVGQRFSVRRDQRVVEEGEVEADVVAHEHRAADELQQRGQHGPGGRGSEHHGVGDAGQGADERGDPLVGLDQGLEGAE